MKLDFDLIKEILIYIESSSDGIVTVWVIPEKLSVNSSQVKIDYHLKILGDDNLIVVQAAPIAPGTTAISRLTAEGHRVLEAMKKDTIWNKIENHILSMGGDGLKAIPALALRYLVTGTV